MYRILELPRGSQSQLSEPTSSMVGTLSWQGFCPADVTISRSRDPKMLLQYDTCSTVLVQHRVIIPFSLPKGQKDFNSAFNHSPLVLVRASLWIQLCFQLQYKHPGRGFPTITLYKTGIVNRPSNPCLYSTGTGT